MNTRHFFKLLLGFSLLPSVPKPTKALRRFNDMTFFYGWDIGHPSPAVFHDPNPEVYQRYVEGRWNC